MFFSNLAEAQQLPIFTQYRANRGYLNPASIDVDALKYSTNLVIGASYRTQWVGLQSGPKTQTLYGTYRSTNSGVNLLAGGYLINDKADRVGFTGLYGRVAGILSNDYEEAGLSVGLTFGGVQYRVNLKGLDAADPLAGGKQGQMNMDVGAGIFAYTRVRDYDYFYGGISIPQALGLDLTFRTENGTFKTKRIQHFYGLIGYYLELNNDAFIEFSSWAKYVKNVPFHADFNMRYHISENFWFGGGYSTSKTAHGEIGVFIPGEYTNIRIGYGYDAAFSTLSNFFGSTHEINVTYSLTTN